MRLPRILITANKSGSGKTLITCGLLEVIKRRGLDARAFKCGPDFIDPMFHKTVLNVESKNLDSFFAEDKLLLSLFAEFAKNADISVIEGAMGYYDGIGFDNTRASACDIGRITKTPAVFVLNARGMSMSAAALLKGFVEFRENSRIKCVILNCVSEMTYMQLKPVIERETGIPVIGYVPYSEDCGLKSRHPGLVTPMELEDIRERIEKMADLIEACVDIDMLLKIAGEAEEVYPEEDFFEESADADKRPVIAVARDEAFCFYYEDNLRLLKKSGASLAFFSPLRDRALPAGCSGIMLGGGYPELYAGQLEKNCSMRMAVRQAVEGGMPCVAECGGFLYLHDKIEDLEHRLYDMAGVIHARGIYTGKLSRFGYINLQLKEGQMYGNAGDTCRGHEFHYYDSESNGCDAVAIKPSGKRQWECMNGDSFFEAGFPHLYYYSNPKFAGNYVDACKRYAMEREQK